MKIMIITTVPQTFHQIIRDQPRFLDNYFDVIVVSSDYSSLSSYAIKYQLGFRVVEMVRKISPIRDFLSVFKLIRLILVEKPDLIHSYTPKAGLVSSISGFVCRTPIRVHTFTGLIFPYSYGLKKMLLKSIDRLICALVTNPVPEGHGVAKLLSDVTSKPLRVVGNGNIAGVDLSHYSCDLFSKNELDGFKSSLGLCDFDVFVFVGRVSYDKGIKELVEAFSTIYESNENIRLLIVGGYDISDCDQELRLRVENSVFIKYVGEVTDIRKYILISEALLLPSYREGFPNVVLQAGALGLPCLVSDVCGSNEIIEDGVNGFIFETHSSKAIVDAVYRFLAHSDKLSLSNNSKQLISKKFDQAIYRDSLLAFYQELFREKNI